MLVGEYNVPVVLICFIALVYQAQKAGLDIFPAYYNSQGTSKAISIPFPLQPAMQSRLRCRQCRRPENRSAVSNSIYEDLNYDPVRQRLLVVVR